MDLRRVFREVFRAIYWIGAIGLGISVATAATFGALRKPRVAEAERIPIQAEPDDPDGRRCALELARVYRELVDRAGRTFVGDGGPSPEFARDWADWSTHWRDELNVIRGRCRLGEQRAMRPLARLADDLERLHLAYTTALHGFSDVGRRQLVQARSAMLRLGLLGGGAPPR